MKYVKLSTSLVVFVMIASAHAQDLSKKVKNFHLVRQVDDMGDTSVALGVNDTDGNPMLLFGCSGDEFKIMFGDNSSFNVTDNSLKVRWKFDKQKTSPTEDWGLSTDNTVIFVPREEKVEFLHKANKANLLAINVLVGPQYNISHTWKFSMKGFSELSKYLTCVK